jgi:hypothetical protein
MAAAAGTGEQRAARELPMCAKVAQYVHTCDVHGWKLCTRDQSAHAKRRVGIALYAMAGFDTLGFEHKAVQIEPDQKTLTMGVCEFTVRTLGVAVPK